MNAPAKFRPIAERHKPDRVTVYVGAHYSELPLTPALSLFVQLGDALDVPVPSHLRFQAWVGDLRTLPQPSEVMELFGVARATAHRWIAVERVKRSKVAA